tara:strand:- start:147 stop:569 length:423 start_codon:yes stop_codon:yes gene_type:complete
MNNETIINDSHSGCSGACTLRNCQYILNNYNREEIDYILKNNSPSESSDESELVHAIQVATPIDNNIVSDTHIHVDDINHHEIKGNAEKLIPTYNLMDENNKKATDVLISHGTHSAVEYMFKHPETGKKMDYATMRYYYG